MRMWLSAPAILLIASCATFSGPGLQQDTSGQSDLGRAASGVPLMYVAGDKNEVVDVYNMTAPLQPVLLYKITDGISQPAGMALDSSGALYVANETGNVAVYAPGATTPTVTLTQGLSKPVDVAIGPKNEIFVADAGPTPAIVVFTPGSMTPSRTILNEHVVSPVQLTFDTTGRMYYSDSKTGVFEVKRGDHRFTRLFGGEALGVAIDSATNILYYETPATTHRGTPTDFVFEMGVNGVKFYRHKKQHSGGGVLYFACIPDNRVQRCVWEPNIHEKRVRVYQTDRGEGHLIQTQANKIGGIAIQPASGS